MISNNNHTIYPNTYFVSLPVVDFDSFIVLNEFHKRNYKLIIYVI